jgi:quercetin dioxygenase-like cupin family protein
MTVCDLERVRADRRRSGRLYLEFLRSAALSVGVYELPAGGTDPQQPHAEDEVYYVVRGRGRVLVGGEDQPVAEGAVVFVPAGVVHRFHEITEDMTLLVFFAPAEGSRAE